MEAFFRFPCRMRISMLRSWHRAASPRRPRLVRYIAHSLSKVA